MPPKPTPTAEEIDALATKFEAVGLNQAKAKDAAKSPKIAEPLKHLVETFNLSERSVTDKQASLLVHFAPPSSKLADDQERGYIVDRIVDGKLKSTDQVNGELISWSRGVFLRFEQSETIKLLLSTLKPIHHQWRIQPLIGSVVSVSLLNAERQWIDLT